MGEIVNTGQWAPVERSVGSGPHVTRLFLLQVSLFYRPLHSRSLVSHFSYYLLPYYHHPLYFVLKQYISTRDESSDDFKRSVINFNFSCF